MTNTTGLRTAYTLVTDALTPYGRREAWIVISGVGGYVCAEPDQGKPDGICGMPAESEPCTIHHPDVVDSDEKRQVLRLSVPSQPTGRSNGVIANSVIDLGRLSLAFGTVNRITYHPDGVTPESDTDHTVMLGLTACALADRWVHLNLNVGLIAQYALVHDLVEVYAGDTPTLRQPGADAKAAKKQREQEAQQRISREFVKTLPWLPSLIGGYEALATREARFVKALDKLLPKITHILNGAATVREQGMSLDEVAARYDAQVDELRAYAADFPELFDLRRELVALVLEQVEKAGTTA